VLEDNVETTDAVEIPADPDGVTDTSLADDEMEAI
jgi:hypothetical protein